MTRVLLAGCLACAACGTSYQPKPSPRITLVVHGGGISFAKNGSASPVGPLGGALPDLVVGDEAVRAARRARHELVFGVPAYVLGFTAAIIGFSLAKPAGWLVGGAGIVLGGSGLAFMGAGAVNAIDAVNLSNDAVSPPFR